MRNMSDLSHRFCTERCAPCILMADETLKAELCLASCQWDSIGHWNSKSSGHFAIASWALCKTWLLPSLLDHNACHGNKDVVNLTSRAEKKRIEFFWLRKSVSCSLESVLIPQLSENGPNISQKEIPAWLPVNLPSAPCEHQLSHVVVPIYTSILMTQTMLQPWISTHQVCPHKKAIMESILLAYQWDQSADSTRFLSNFKDWVWGLIMSISKFIRIGGGQILFI